MPVTPFHMGPGLIFKALLQGSFSLVVFGWTQLAMDLQPLLVLISGTGNLHGFSHTYLGAALITVAAGLSGKYVAEVLLRLLDLTRNLPMTWSNAMSSALIGAFSHVLLDSLVYDDMAPFAPVLEGNPFLGYLTIKQVYSLCLASGLVGVVLYVVLALRYHKRLANAERSAQGGRNIDPAGTKRPSLRNDS